MSISEQTETQIFDRILSACNVVDDKYELNFEYRGKPEKFVFTKEDIEYLVKDIVYEHPMSTTYRKATILLAGANLRIIKEGNLFLIPKTEQIFLKCSIDDYRNAIKNLLDLSKTSKEDINALKVQFQALGYNPTQELGKDPKEKSWHSLALLFKLWRSKPDADKGITKEQIHGDMLNMLTNTDVKECITKNDYIYSAFVDAAGKILA